MRAIATGAAALAALIVAAVIYLPIAQQPLELEPDFSFRATMNDAFARGLQFGPDLVTNHGPWGVLQRGYDRRTDGVVLAVSALLAAVFAWGVLRLAFDAGGGAGAALAAIIGTGCLLAAAAYDTRFTVIAVLLVLSAMLPPSPARELPLAAALGLVALVKLSLLMLAVFVVAMTALVRRSAAIPIVFTVAFLGAWIAAGQRLASLPLFFVRGWEIVRGYSGAVASGAHVPAPVVGACGFAIAALLVERTLPLRLLFAGTALYFAKIGFVRADLIHETAATALLLILVVPYVLLRRERLPGLRRTAVAATIAVAAIVAVATFPSLADWARAQWRWMRDRPARLADVERQEARRAEAALLPAVRGTIDAYPWGSAALIARGLRYTPRPVPESYMAWTAKLAELNADFLRGPRAPEWLWAGVGSIDERYPLLDDAPSWLEMLRRYDVAAAISDHLLLHKRAAIKNVVITPLTSAHGSDVAVPDAPVVWCAIDTQPSLVSRLGNFVGRPSLLTLELVTARGATTRWRASRAQLAGGFIVSPLVADVGGLNALLSGNAGERVARIRVAGEDVQFRFSAISQRP